MSEYSAFDFGLILICSLRRSNSGLGLRNYIFELVTLYKIYNQITANFRERGGQIIMGQIIIRWAS